MLAEHVSPPMTTTDAPPDYTEAELALLGARARIAALQAEIQLLIRRYPQLLADFPQYKQRAPLRADEREAASRRQRERWARYRWENRRPLRPGDREVLESLGIKVERRREGDRAARAAGSEEDNR